MTELRGVIIRPATPGDGEAIFPLVERFATSFDVQKSAFRASLPNILADASACLLIAETDGALLGYLLGFDHLAFFANGRVAWVEEIMVAESFRQRGIGRSLMKSFDEWGRSRQCRLIALATRRAAPFYRALGYEESAAYFRKLL